MGSSTDRETDVRAAWCRTKSTLPVTARHALRSVMLPSTNWMRSSTDSRLSTRPLDRSSSTTTSWPSVTRCSTRWEPMNPAPPVTKYFIAARTSPVGTVQSALPQVLGPTRRPREALVLRRREGRCRYGRGPWSDERRAVPVLLLHHHRWLGPRQARGVCFQLRRARNISFPGSVGLGKPELLLPERVAPLHPVPRLCEPGRGRRHASCFCGTSMTPRGCAMTRFARGRSQRPGRVQRRPGWTAYGTVALASRAADPRRVLRRLLSRHHQRHAVMGEGAESYVPEVRQPLVPRLSALRAHHDPA